MLKAFKDGGRGLTCTPEYDAWLHELEEDVIQGEYGYERGEFTVYSTHWAELYLRGLTPAEAWRRALDGYANQRKAEEAERDANWARIVAADQAAIAKAKFADKNG